MPIYKFVFQIDLFLYKKTWLFHYVTRNMQSLSTNNKNDVPRVYLLSSLDWLKQNETPTYGYICHPCFLILCSLSRCQTNIWFYQPDEESRCSLKTSFLLSDHSDSKSHDIFMYIKSLFVTSNYLLPLYVLYYTTKYARQKIVHSVLLV